MYALTHADYVRDIMNPMRFRAWLRRYTTRNIARQLARAYQALYSIVL